jgi:amino-acid N-acetyltransferase
MYKPESTYQIRLAQPNDQKIIPTLLLGYKLPLDGLENTKLWILQLKNGEVAGIAGLEVYCDQGLLRSVAVVDGMRNHGYGAILTKHVISEAKKESIPDLFLLTTTAPTFFNKFGFKNENREKIIGGIRNSVEFKSACPKTAILMRLSTA